MPLLKTKLALKTLPIDDMLVVTADDAGTQRDFPAFLRLSQFNLIEARVENGCFIYRIVHRKEQVAPASESSESPAPYA